MSLHPGCRVRRARGPGGGERPWSGHSPGGLVGGPQVGDVEADLGEGLVIRHDEGDARRDRDGEIASLLD